MSDMSSFITKQKLGLIKTESFGTESINHLNQQSLDQSIENELLLKKTEAKHEIDKLWIGQLQDYLKSVSDEKTHLLIRKTSAETAVKSTTNQILEKLLEIDALKAFVQELESNYLKQSLVLNKLHLEELELDAKVTHLNMQLLNKTCEFDRNNSTFAPFHQAQNSNLKWAFTII